VNQTRLERLEELHALSDEFANRLSALAVEIQDDEDQEELQKKLDAALGGMEAVTLLLGLAVYEETP
jgi:hypothetical protein